MLYALAMAAALLLLPSVAWRFFSKKKKRRVRPVGNDFGSLMRSEIGKRMAN
jgi:hypothetical protein